MASPLDVKRLHGLYQVIGHVGSVELDHPLVCLAQVERRPSSSRSGSPDPLHLGDIEWVVALGTQKTSTAAPATKRRKKQGTVDVWWEARLCGREVDDLFQQVPSAAVKPEVMPARVRECWSAGGLAVSGYIEGEEPRGGIELVMQITPTLPLTLVLTPCDDPPFSMTDILSHMINPFLSATQHRVDAANSLKQLERLNAEHDKVCKLLEIERDASKRQRRVPGTQLRHFSGDSASGPSGGAPFGRRRSSQEQSQGASQGSVLGGGTPQSPTEERDLSLSPSKVIPGVTHRGVLKPGDPGYAGSSRRIGRVVEDTPWDEEPPTDSD
ncbi:hypothetical protein JCM3775_005606 [Rhodotorula graminis]|uniref:Uncharacterized protein n=1 Tax=Rhodotorula graminis (strain WP1) TaxID=578459 RepID=A0A194SAE1_RHOGW|nr:uncharacterized protein RHOBADRAFT_51506 [Rhodotorula graminis WP1]KPV77688.1 hypothetical protein RHOBADRAFT_51506 [Rhodotorula graminis WP1]